MASWTCLLATYKDCPRLTPPVTKITAAKKNLYYEPQDGTIHCATCGWSTAYVSDITMATLRCPAHPMGSFGTNDSSTVQGIQGNNERPVSMCPGRSTNANAPDNYKHLQVMKVKSSEHDTNKFRRSYRSADTVIRQSYNRGEDEVDIFTCEKSVKSDASKLAKKLKETLHKMKIRSEYLDDVPKLTIFPNRYLAVTDEIRKPENMYSKEANRNEHLADYTKMKKLENRLRTFELVENWPDLCPVPYQALAEAGFYYMGRGDIVKCAFCGKRLHQWENDDDPVVEHCKFSPFCEYAQSLR